MKAAAVVVMILTLIEPNAQAETFPLQDFFKLTIPEFRPIKDFDLLYKEKFLCSDLSRCCDCKEECVLSESCCIDKFWNKSNPMPLPQYINKVINEHKKIKPLGCASSLPFAQGSKYKTTYYKMVATCVSGANKEDVLKCTNDTSLVNYDRIPVFGSDRYLYKNSFCAKCNLINQYSPANISLKCKDRFTPSGPDVNTTVLESYGGCSIEILGNMQAYQPVTCKQDERKVVCTSRNLQDLCDSYKGQIGVQKNPHCYICQGNMYNPSLFDRPCFSGIGGFRYSVTISFGKDSTKINSGGQTFSFCGKGERYNFIDQTCEKASCAPDFQFDGTSCIRVQRKCITFEDPGYLKCLSARNATLYAFVKHRLGMFNKSVLVKDFEEDFGTTNEQFLPVLETSQGYSIHRREKTLTYSDVVRMQDIINNSTSLKLWESDVEILIASTSINSVTSMYKFDLNRYFHNSRVCFTRQIYFINAGNFTESCQFKLKNDSMIVNHEDLSLFMRINKEGEKASISQCLQYHLNESCHVIRINSSTYTFDNLTKSLMIYSKEDNQTFLYQPHQYLPGKDRTFYICSRNRKQTQRLPKKQYSWETTIADTEFYIGLTLVIISVIFEIVFIITFTLNNDLHTSGGANVLFMVILLLISDMLFILIVIIDGQPYNACKTFAILMHWALLSVDIWGTVLAADIAIMLLSPRTKSVKQNIAKMTFNKALCTMMSTVALIVLCVVLNETTTLNFGYGKNKICWITEYYPKLGFFMIPAVLACFVSTICLVSTLVYLYRQEKEQWKRLSNSGRKDMDLASIALKLIVVLGLAETIGLIQIVKTNLSEDEKIVNSSFALLYSFIRSIRGTLLFWLYLGNKKTLKFYKTWLTKKQKPDDIALHTKLTSSTD